MIGCWRTTRIKLCRWGFRAGDKTISQQPLEGISFMIGQRDLTEMKRTDFRRVKHAVKLLSINRSAHRFRVGNRWHNLHFFPGHKISFFSIIAVQAVYHDVETVNIEFGFYLNQHFSDRSTKSFPQKASCYALNFGTDISFKQPHLFFRAPVLSVECF